MSTSALDDVTFPPRFLVAPGALPPGVPERVFYYPGATTRGGHDGVIVDVNPSNSGEPWTGVFARGDYPRGLDCIVTLPDRERFLVVCEGAGYIVCANDPTDWGEARADPVMSVLAVGSHDLVVIGDLTDLAAYGRHGLEWESGRLVWDDLAIDGIVGNTLHARGFDLSLDGDAEFEVDLMTGQARGAPFTDG
jgi:hypothetical protein